MVPGTASSGVDIIYINGFTASNSNAMQIIERNINIITVLPIARFACLVSFAPAARPIITVEPIARPTIITVSICITWLPIETAVVLSTPLNCPIINRSAIPYNVCKKYESRYGSEKYIIDLKTLPVVRSLFIFKPPI